MVCRPINEYCIYKLSAISKVGSKDYQFCGRVGLESFKGWICHETRLVWVHTPFWVASAFLNGYVMRLDFSTGLRVHCGQTKAWQYILLLAGQLVDLRDSTSRVTTPFCPHIWNPFLEGTLSEPRVEELICMQRSLICFLEWPTTNFSPYQRVCCGQSMGWPFIWLLVGYWFTQGTLRVELPCLFALACHSQATARNAGMGHGIQFSRAPYQIRERKNWYACRDPWSRLDPCLVCRMAGVGKGTSLSPGNVLDD